MQESGTKSKAMAKSIQVKIEPTAIPAPEPVSFFNFTRFQSDVSMAVGYINIPVAVDILKKAKDSADTNVELPATITHQFQLSIINFFELRERVEAFARQLERDGIQMRKDSKQ